eukprot:3651210-Pleurochrysis_carterae.AAC.1
MCSHVVATHDRDGAAAVVHADRTNSEFRHSSVRELDEASPLALSEVGSPCSSVARVHGNDENGGERIELGADLCAAEPEDAIEEAEHANVVASTKCRSNQKMP